MNHSWDGPLYYASTPLIGFYERQWEQFYPTLGREGKFWIDLAKFFNGHNCFISRSGDWVSPWEFAVVPGFEMPKYDPNFKDSFADITDRRALDIKNLIHASGKHVAIFYSGGIDSTVCLAAVIRNFTTEELKHIHVCMSVESLTENPSFYENFIHKKLNVLDSAVNRYNDILSKGYYAITADQGDCLFGTEAAIQLYRVQNSLLNKLSSHSRSRIQNLLQQTSASEVPYNDVADLIRLYFHLDHNPDFGPTLYDFIVYNIKTSQVPIHSVHDFFWWIIFNIKYMHCAMRSVIAYSGGEDQQYAVQEGIINWFNHVDYQRWSLANNNNGQKIRGTSPMAYKWAARQYINMVDKNPWYLNNKMKLASLGAIISRSPANLDRLSIFGMDKNYRILKLNDLAVREKVEQCLRVFKF